MVKRDSITPPDVGQVVDFGGQNPEPIRNGNGSTFLANSNHQIGAQNPDNIAAPPSDARPGPRSRRARGAELRWAAGRRVQTASGAESSKCL